MEPNALETTVSDIIARLRQGRFPNEQAISQGIVLRVLQELSWDTWDTAVVWPEYQTGQGRADFALCHPPSKPAMLDLFERPPAEAAETLTCNLARAPFPKHGANLHTPADSLP